MLVSEKPQIGKRSHRLLIKNLERNGQDNDLGPEQDAKSLLEMCWAITSNYISPCEMVLGK